MAKKLGYSNPHKAIRDHTKDKGVTIRSVLSKGGKQNKKFIKEVITMEKIPKLKQKVRVFNKYGEQIDPATYPVPDHIKEAVQVVLRKGGVK